MLPLDNITVLEEVSSTQDVVKEAFLRGEIEGYGVRAIQQISGRGRYSRQWQSQVGNFLFSVLLTPRKSLLEASQLSFVSVNAIYDSVVHVCGESVVDDLLIKWPNDLLLSRKKVSGLLLEVENIDNRYGVVLGVGVNIVDSPEEGISLQEYTDELVIDADDFSSIFMKHLANRYQQWHDYGFEEIRKLWIERSGSIGKTVLVRLMNEEFSGRVLDLDHDGALVLECDDKKMPRRVTAGDVFFSGPL